MPNLTFAGNPDVITIEQGTSATRKFQSQVSWNITDYTAQYEIESFSIRFKRQTSGYGVIATKSGNDFCSAVNYSNKPSTETYIFVTVPQSYWENRTSDSFVLSFYSPMAQSVRQIYREISLYIVLKAKAFPSTATVDTVNVGAEQTVTLSNDSLSSLSHKVTWAYGSVTNTVDTIVGQRTVSWPVPSDKMATVCALSPNSRTVSGTVTVNTYLPDEGDSVLIGTTATTAQLTIPDDTDTKPTISGTIAAAKSSDAPNTQTLLQRYTDVTLTNISATAKYEASISSYRLVVRNNGSEAFSTDITSGTTVFDHVAWPAGTNTVAVVVTDSRGISNEKTLDVTLAVYTLPAITDIDVARYSLSKQALDDEGDAFQVTVSAVFDTNAGAGTTPYSAVAKQGSTQIATATNSNNVFVVGDTSHTTSPEETYSIEVTVTDGYGKQTTQTTEIGTSVYTIYRLAGGKGVSFGKAADKYGVEVNEDWPFYTHGQEIQQMLLDYAHPVGSVLETLDEEFDPNEQWPWTKWGKLEDVFLLASGTRSVLDEGGSETTSVGTQVTFTLEPQNLPKYSVFAATTSAYPDVGYDTTNLPTGFPAYDARVHSRVSGYGYLASTDDAEPVSATASGSVSTMPPYLTVNIWVRSR